MFHIVIEQVPLDRMGTMMGVATLIVAISPAVGPSCGGLVIKYWGWPMIFVILLPLLLAALLMGAFSIRQVTKPQKVTFDWIGFLLLSVGFVGLIFATSSAGSLGWVDVRVIGAFVVCALALSIFYHHSLKDPNPILRPSVFKVRAFTLSVIVIGIVQFVCLGLGFLLPNYSQLVSGEKPLVAGFLLLPGCISGAFTTPSSGLILD